MKRWQLAAVLALGGWLGASSAFAQGTNPAANGGAPQAGGVAPAADAGATAGGLTRQRAAWLGDSRPLRVGDLLTVIIDEATSGQEKVSRTATAARSRDATLSADANGESAVGRTAIRSALDGSSRDVGAAGRSGDLTGTITVQVKSVDEHGNAEIAGTKEVTIDGRRQEVMLSGMVRGEDVGPTNVVYSSRIAGAKIAYQGKQIGPKGGFFGKLLSILWP
jgi:flagellar basal body L-ring protein FlgH